MAHAILSLADVFLNIFPESKATKPLSPHSYFSVVAAEQWREDTPSPRERALPRKAGWYPCHHCHPWATAASPSLDLVSTLRACCAVLVLTSDFGREEEVRKGHHGRTSQPQSSRVPLPLGEHEALSPRMLCHQTGRKDLGDTISIPAWGWHQQLHRVCKKGRGFI